MRNVLSSLFAVATLLTTGCVGTGLSVSENKEGTYVNVAVQENGQTVATHLVYGGTAFISVEQFGSRKNVTLIATGFCINGNRPLGTATHQFNMSDGNNISGTQDGHWSITSFEGSYVDCGK